MENQAPTTRNALPLSRRRKSVKVKDDLNKVSPHGKQHDVFEEQEQIRYRAV